MSQKAVKGPMIKRIRAKVGSEPDWAERAIVALFAWQTEDEQKSNTAKESNGRGFGGGDASLLSSFAQQILGLPQPRRGYHDDRGNWRRAYIVPAKPPRHLTTKQLHCAFQRLPKYAAQLHRISEAKKRSEEPQGMTA